MKIIYLYVTGLVMALVVTGYVMGGRVAAQKCRVRVAADAIAAQTQIIKAKEAVDAETVHRDVDDIRRVLRTKYTIAD